MWFVLPIDESHWGVENRGFLGLDSTPQADVMNSFKVAVVGTGFIGPVHVEALRRAGQTVTGIVGSSREKSVAAAARLGLAKGYASLAEVLDDDEVQSVHIATPNELHFEQAGAVLRSGRHVICEKPLAMTSTETAELVKIASERNCVAGVSYNLRFYPLCHEAASQRRGGGNRQSDSRAWFVHARLAVATDRLQLAGGIESGRRAESRRGHRDSLVGLGAIRDGPQSGIGDVRSAYCPSGTDATGRRSRNVFERRQDHFEKGDPKRAGRHRRLRDGDVPSRLRCKRMFVGFANDGRTEERVPVRDRGE